MSYVHVSGPTAPPGVEDSEHDICCMGAAMRGAAYCTCWDPILDLEQAEADTTTVPTSRAKCCHDCAFRQGSPERERDDGELDEILVNPERVFWCHQGMPKVVAWRHPDGRELPGGPEDDYKPLILDGVPYLADGTAGERCAGWAFLHPPAPTPLSQEEEFAKGSSDDREALLDCIGALEEMEYKARELGHRLLFSASVTPPTGGKER